ncbi:hypothetical protein GCM10025734_19010 [Kitasatospora paranensis]
MSAARAPRLRMKSLPGSAAIPRVVEPGHRRSAETAYRKIGARPELTKPPACVLMVLKASQR